MSIEFVYLLLNVYHHHQYHIYIMIKFLFHTKLITLNFFIMFLRPYETGKKNADKCYLLVESILHNRKKSPPKSNNIPIGNQLSSLYFKWHLGYKNEIVRLIRILSKFWNNYTFFKSLWLYT